MSAASNAAELSSLRAQIEDITRRVVSMADGYRSGPDAGMTTDLDQAERSLLVANRALGRVAGDLEARA